MRSLTAVTRSILTIHESNSHVQAFFVYGIALHIAEHQCRYGLVINNGDEIIKLSQSVIQLPAMYL